jgi:hypothetical protein
MVVEVVGTVRRPWVRKWSGLGMRGSRMGLMSLSWVRMLLKMEVRGLVVRVRLCGKNRNAGLRIHAMPTRTSSVCQLSHQDHVGILTGGSPDLDERLLLLVHPWLPPPFPGPGGPNTPLYL